MGVAVAVAEYADIIARMLSEAPAVERIYVSDSGPSLRVFTIRVFTIIDTEDENVYEDIYKWERIVIGSVGTKVQFNVIAPRAREHHTAHRATTPITRAHEGETLDLLRLGHRRAVLFCLALH